MWSEISGGQQVFQKHQVDVKILLQTQETPKLPMAPRQAESAAPGSISGDPTAQEFLARLNQRWGAVERDGRNNIASRMGRNNEHRGSGALVWYIVFAGILHPYCEVLLATW